MNVIFFVMAGLVVLWVLISMIRVMGIKEIVISVSFTATLVVVCGGVLRGAADKAGFADRELPGVWGAIERVFR